MFAEKQLVVKNFSLPLHLPITTLMKTIHTLMLLAAMLIISACKGEDKPKTPEDIIIHKFEKPTLSPPIKMENQVTTSEFTFGGNQMKAVIERSASDSLPYVKDNIGQEFVDNVITLTITQADGSVYLKRKFTKANFNNRISEEFRNNGILSGIAFGRANNDSVFFGASVSLPELDEQWPMLIILTNGGKIEIIDDNQPEV